MANTNTVYSIPGVHEVAGMVVSPSGGQVRFIGTAAQINALGEVGEAIASRCDTTTNAAVANAVSGRGDWFFWLPGYTESIATADAWSALAATDVTMCALGHGTNRATLTWTTPTSTVLFDQANFRVINARMFLAGAHSAGSALTVAAPIAVSAAGCEISGGNPGEGRTPIFWGFDVDQIVTIGITTTAAADHFNMHNVFAYAETAAVPTTTFLRLVGADYLNMSNVKIQGPGSTTTLAPVQFLTTASLGIDMCRCIIQNQLAASIHAVTGMAGLTGTASQCGWGILDNATLAGFVTPGNMQFFACYTANENGEEGVLMTPQSV